MQEFRDKKDIKISTIIKELHKEPDEPIQFSFITKMLNLINPNNPIFDVNVSAVLKLSKTKEQSVIDIYNRLCSYYSYLVNNETITLCLIEFDKAFDIYANKLSTIKKIDFLLWCAGKEL